jgi:hypothetical protein
MGCNTKNKEIIARIRKEKVFLHLFHGSPIKEEDKSVNVPFVIWT